MFAKITFLLIILKLSKATADADSVIKEFEPMIQSVRNELLELKNTIQQENHISYQYILKSIEIAEQNMNQNTENLLKQVENETSAIPCNPDLEEQCQAKKKDDVNTYVIQPPLAHAKACVNIFLNQSTGHFNDLVRKIDKNITDVENLNENCTKFSSNDNMRWCFFEELTLRHIPNTAVLRDEFLNVKNNIESIIKYQKDKMDKCIEVLAYTDFEYSRYPINYYMICCNK